MFLNVNLRALIYGLHRQTTIEAGNKAKPVTVPGLLSLNHYIVQLQLTASKLSPNYVLYTLYNMSAARKKKTISWHMQGAISEIKAQYKEAVYLAEKKKKVLLSPPPPVVVNKKDDDDDYQHLARLHAHHNGLLPRQFVPGFVSQYEIGNHPRTTSVLPTSELPLDTLDDFVPEVQREENIITTKLPRPSPARRLYRTTRQHSETTLRNIGSASMGINRAAPAPASQSFAARFLVPTPPKKKKKRHVVVSASSRKKVFIENQTHPKLFQVSSEPPQSVAPAGEISKSRVTISMWVREEDDLLQYGEMIPLTQPRPSSSDGTCKQKRRIVGMIVL